MRWNRGCCGFAVSPLPHRAGEKRKCFAANLQTICRGRCLSSSCGLCGIANHSIYNAIACRACLSDHDKRLFWRIFLTHTRFEEAQRFFDENKEPQIGFSIEDIAKKLLGDDYTEDWYPEEEQERDRRNMVISSYIASTTAALFWWVDG